MSESNRKTGSKNRLDQNLYGDSNEYADEIVGEVDERQAEFEARLREGQRANANKDQLIEETKLEGGSGILGGLTQEQELFKSKRIVDRESDYHREGRKVRGTALSPERTDFFDSSGVGAKRTHKTIMQD